MKIKFHSTLYNLKGAINVMPTHFQATIDKENVSVDSVILDTENVEAITIYDDEDNIIGVYTNYTKRVAISIITDISVEFENTDIAGAISALTQKVSTLEETQAEQASAIEELTPYTDTKTGYFGETEKTFYGVPEGNVTVFFDNYNGSYSVERIEDRLTVSFNVLEAETNITISIK